MIKKKRKEKMTIVAVAKAVIIIVVTHYHYSIITLHNIAAITIIVRATTTLLQSLQLRLSLHFICNHYSF